MRFPKLRGSLKKRLLPLFTITAGFIISSCSQVEIKNQEICAIAGSSGSFCFETLTTNHRDLTKDQWDIASFGWMAMSPDAFVYFQDTINKLCSVTDKCTTEQKEQLKAFFRRAEYVQKRLEHY